MGRWLSIDDSHFLSATDSHLLSHTPESLLQATRLQSFSYELNYDILLLRVTSDLKSV